MASKRQTLDQKRAAQAWQDVKEVDKQNNEELKRKYNSLTRSAPALVQSNGLGQALAFLRAKAGREKKGEHWLLYKHLSAWVMEQLKENEKKQLKPQEKEQLLEWVVQQETAVYRRATNETMAYLHWLKRFAEAVLPEATAGER